MSRLSPAEQLRQALEESLKRDPHHEFQEMVDRGAIDKEGNVLLIGPGHDKLTVPTKRKKPRR